MIDPNRTCSWCGHSKAKHATARFSVSETVVGCLVRISGSGFDAKFCQCTASRGVVRTPRKAQK